jgi:hypothetical protein
VVVVWFGWLLVYSLFERSEKRGGVGVIWKVMGGTGQNNDGVGETGDPVYSSFPYSPLFK